MAPGWPVTLSHADIQVRPLRVRDARVWHEQRRANAAWLRPWEATVPPGSREQAPSFAQMVRRLRQDAADGRGMPFAIDVAGHLVGQVNVAGMAMGSYRGCQIGYWVDQRHAGRGIVPVAVALVSDHLFRAVGLHRIEIAIRPENAASIRVVEKLGFREEGVRPRYLHIDGDWRDHVIYALHAEDVAGELLSRLTSR